MGWERSDIIDRCLQIVSWNVLFIVFWKVWKERIKNYYNVIEYNVYNNVIEYNGEDGSIVYNVKNEYHSHFRTRQYTMVYCKCSMVYCKCSPTNVFVKYKKKNKRM